MKKCSKCKIPKDLSQFDNKKDTKDGHAGKCKSCVSEYNRLYRQENHEVISLYKKKYSQTDAGKILIDKANRKCAGKYPNAQKSRAFFFRNKCKDELILKCSKCQAIEKIEAHHHDYNKPMEVIYFCKKCHVGWHAKNTPLNRVSGIFTEKN